KKTIIRAYNKIKGIDTNPFKDFSKSFGFEISDKGIPDAYRYSFYIEIQTPSKSIDISKFKELYVIDYKMENNRISINYSNKTLDITDSVIKNLKKDTSLSESKITQKTPLFIKDSSGFTCIITNLSARTADDLTDEQIENYKKDSSGLQFYCYGIEGFAVK
nr:hypothetical protein [Treponema sp.]